MSKLKLPKTQLSLSDGALRKIDVEGAVVAEFPVEEIQDIRCEASTDYVFPGILFFVFFALAVVARMFIPIPGVSWATAIICVGVSLFCLMLIQGKSVVIETKEGSASYPVSDTYEDADGFVMTVRSRLKSIGESGVSS